MPYLKTQAAKGVHIAGKRAARVFRLEELWCLPSYCAGAPCCCLRCNMTGQSKIRQQGRKAVTPAHKDVRL
jgi:hypothetical protein